MIEFIALMIILDLLCKWVVREEPDEGEKFNPYDNGTAERYIKENSWEFKSIDDCFDFRELRRTGWRGNAEDFYKLKAEEESEVTK